jgi:hypothetical protein
MQVGYIVGATRTLGKAQGYLGLPVKDEMLGCGAPQMTTAWLPTPEEIIAIVGGAAIYVRILGSSHPPILVDVGPVPE